MAQSKAVGSMLMLRNSCAARAGTITSKVTEGGIVIRSRQGQGFEAFLELPAGLQGAPAINIHEEEEEVRVGSSERSQNCIPHLSPGAPVASP